MAFSPDLGPVTLTHHIAFLAASAFATKHGRLPGASLEFTQLVQSLPSASPSPEPKQGEDVSEEDFEADAAELCVLARTEAAKFDADDDALQLVEQAATEMARAGMSSIPSTAALMGGVAAQEAIKYITHQYTPEMNTVVYSGMEQSVGVFSL